MRNTITLCLLFIQALAIMAQPKITTPDLSVLSSFQPVNRTITLTKDQAGNAAVHVDAQKGPGVVWIKQLNFSGGTLEFDVKGKDVLQESFVGIAFHGVNDSTYESVYFRPFNFRASDPVRHKHAVQYIALPRYDWFNLRESFPDKYEHAIVPDVNPNTWFHVKVVVKPSLIQVFVNSDPTACLSLQPLMAPVAGQVGFWVGNGSDGDFANLTVMHVN